MPAARGGAKLYHVGWRANGDSFDVALAVNRALAAGARAWRSLAASTTRSCPIRRTRRSPPRVAASPCALECKWVQTVSLTDYEGRPTDRHVVFGQVIGVHIDERFIRDGLLDTGAMRPIMRAGYHDYYGAAPELRFAMRRPAGGGGQG